MFVKNLALVLATVLVTGCGANAAMQGQEQQDQRSDDDSADATGTRKKKKVATKDQGERANASELDCSGIPMHGDHETCDEDDVKVAEGTDLPEAGHDDVEPKDDATDSEPTDGELPDDGTTPTEEPAKPEEPVKDPNIVEFRIAAGTGRNPLNTPDTFVSAKVGQTLRFYNDDTITHRFHTGGIPCPHGPNFAPGTSYDCVLTREIDTVARPGALYEHISGPTALFYLKVTK
jgi:hypothetical protein